MIHNRGQYGFLQVEIYVQNPSLDGGLGFAL